MSDSVHEPATPLRRRDLFKAGAAFSLAAVALGGTTTTGFATATPAADEGVVPIPLPEQVKTTESLVDVGDGHSLWCLDSGGDGTPVVLMHAGTGSALVWGYQTPVFAKAGYRVIAYSRRGYYGSTVGDTKKPGTGASDLLKVVDRYELDKFHLVGTAAGAMFATDFAVSHPDRLKSLVLSNTIVGIRNDDYRAIYKLLWPDEFDPLPHDFKELGPSYRHIDAEGRKLWNELEHKAKTVKMDSQGYDNTVTWDSLAAWKMPVLVSTGAADLYTPPSMARLVQSRIPGAELGLTPDSGHSSYWERPHLWNEMVLDFIGRHNA
ncbi:alpha/beta hydrolase [Mesorhizobium sp. 8]|uniref:alpha/beta fold hydrolase n=1 Tax=Mesorhizobium sp. 8 TaxID=2584466 RepID=UPI00111E94B5|nr:alpha/beta hydrolase [Mesorhizobium sp. 8]QDC02213.1 alpha/beta hydrolase [Mesorhizobium sp. 8]